MAGVEITKRLVLKFVELVFVCVLMGLLFTTTWGYNGDHDFLQSGTFLGYLIILAGLLLGEVMGKPVDKVLDMFFSIVGCAFFIAVGAINVQKPYSQFDKNITKGAFSIINGIIFFIDAVLYYLDK